MYNLKQNFVMYQCAKSFNVVEPLACRVHYYGSALLQYPAIGGLRYRGRIQNYFEHPYCCYADSSSVCQQRVVHIHCHAIDIGNEQERGRRRSLRRSEHYFHNGDGITAVLWFVLMSL